MIRYALFVAALLAGCVQSPGSDFVVTNEMREQAIAAHNPQLLDASLLKIEQWHIEHGTQIPTLLNPGLTDEGIDARFKDIGCLPTNELRALWKWRNGHSDTGIGQWLVWYHQFLPLDDAIDEYRRLKSSPFSGWNRYWIPVFQFQGEWYFVECGDREVPASPLMHYFIESGMSHNYVSLTTYLATASQWFEEGAVYAEGVEANMADSIAHVARIHARLNPGLPFPYYVPE